MNHNVQPRALGRITVLDLTRVRAGPACVRQFGDWGANVIKVEARVTDPNDAAQADFSARHEADFQNLHRSYLADDRLGRRSCIGSSSPATGATFGALRR